MYINFLFAFLIISFSSLNGGRLLVGFWCLHHSHQTSCFYILLVVNQGLVPPWAAICWVIKLICRHLLATHQIAGVPLLMLENHWIRGQEVMVAIWVPTLMLTDPKEREGQRRKGCRWDFPTTLSQQLNSLPNISFKICHLFLKTRKTEDGVTSTLCGLFTEFVFLLVIS